MNCCFQHVIGIPMFNNHLSYDFDLHMYNVPVKVHDS